MKAEKIAKWCVRTMIDASAFGIGVGTLPISFPLVVTARALRVPWRAVAVSAMDGSLPVIGPPIARALDGLLYEAP